jgi:hypothetical protein
MPYVVQAIVGYTDHRDEQHELSGAVLGLYARADSAVRAASEHEALEQKDTEVFWMDLGDDASAAPREDAGVDLDGRLPPHALSEAARRALEQRREAEAKRRTRERAHGEAREEARRLADAAAAEARRREAEARAPQFRRWMEEQNARLVGA